MNAFYKLASLTMNPWSLTKTDYEHARNSWLCTGCSFPKPGARVIDIIIQENVSENIPLNFVNGCGLGIVRKDFLQSFDNGIVQDHLVLGNVFGPAREPLKEWATFVGRHRIIVRASKNAGMRRCSDCGRIVYFAMGKPYLFPAPLAAASIFDGGNGVLVVREKMMVNLHLNKWRKLDCRKLSVAAVPEDGLGEL